MDEQVGGERPPQALVRELDGLAHELGRGLGVERDLGEDGPERLVAEARILAAASRSGRNSHGT